MSSIFGFLPHTNGFCSPSGTSTSTATSSPCRHTCPSMDQQRRRSNRLNSGPTQLNTKDGMDNTSRVNCCMRRYNRSSSTQQHRQRLQQRSLLWFVYLSLLALLIHLPTPVLSQVNLDITTEVTDPPATPGPFNPRECFDLFDNIHQVLYVCSERKELFPILKYAERVGQEECKKAFKDELWNCSNFSLLKEPNITKGDDFLQESAYIHALSVSVIAHTVAKACTQGLIPECSCDVNSVTMPMEDDSSSVMYTGCSLSIEYGLEVAETFLNKRYASTGRVLKLELVQHNIKAAKMLVKDVVENSPVVCQCHGVSGSCTMQSCRSDLPDFSAIGEKLKEKHQEACRVSSNGRANHAWVSKCGRNFDDEDFIFRDTYDWCIPDPSVNSVGVVGRECDPNSSGSNSCENICRRCNRGVVRREEKVTGDCHCSFKFCCEIECRQCEVDRVYYMCS